MADGVAHKHWWQIFEVVFGIPFLVAIVLQLVLPFGCLADCSDQF